MGCVNGHAILLRRFWMHKNGDLNYLRIRRVIEEVRFFLLCLTGYLSYCVKLHLTDKLKNGHNGHVHLYVRSLDGI